MARVPRGEWRATHPRLQFDHLLRKTLRRVTVWIEQDRSAAIAAGCTTEPQIYAPGRECIQHAKLLGHFERGVVRQHDACTAKADALGARRDRCQQDFGRGACNAGQIVMLADPEPGVTPFFTALRQIQRLANRGVLWLTVRHHRLVEHREFEHGFIIRMPNTPPLCFSMGISIPWTESKPV